MSRIGRGLWAWTFTYGALCLFSASIGLGMYQAQLAPWWMLQPDLQCIIRPGGGVLNPGGSFRPNAWVIGLRSSLNF